MSLPEPSRKAFLDGEKCNPVQLLHIVFSGCTPAFICTGLHFSPSKKAFLEGSGKLIKVAESLIDFSTFSDSMLSPVVVPGSCRFGWTSSSAVSWQVGSSIKVTFMVSV